MSHPLEPDRATVDEWMRILGGYALEHIEAVGHETALGQVGAAGMHIAERVSTPIPEDPLPGGPIRIREILSQAMTASLVTTGPGYCAYIPGGGLVASAVAAFVAECTNRYTGLAAAAPGPCRLEADVLTWLAQQFGYGPAARGCFTSGGSLANFSAIVAARHHHLGPDGDLRKGVAYVSSQVHHSVAKSWYLAGFPPANLRSIAVDGRLRMKPDALVAAIARDRRAQLHPFLLVSSAGTTNTGAIDPLADLNVICATHDLWHHVDGAYGGAFVLCPTGRKRLQGIEGADSVTFDPHKGMFLPYGTGCLLVRDGQRLRSAHAATAGYLQDLGTAHEEIPSPCDYGPELSRDYRGLRVWLPLMWHGARAFRDALEEKLSLTTSLYDELVARIEGGLVLELVDAPQLSVVAFRLPRRPRERLEGWNLRNAAFLARINEYGRVYLSSTVLPTADGPAFTLRLCILSFRTHLERILQGLEDIESAAREAA